MPQKRVHQIITVTAMACVVPAALVLEPYQFWCIQAGMAVTIVPEMGPDLDVNNRRFGALAEFIGLRGYAKLVPHRYGLRKRHWHNLRVWNIFFFSHVPFAGTIPRALILAFPVFAIAMITNNVSLGVFSWLLFIYIGMGVSDTLHVLADIGYSFVRGKASFKEVDKGYWMRRRNRGNKRYNKKPRTQKPDTWLP